MYYGVITAPDNLEDAMQFGNLYVVKEFEGADAGKITERLKENAIIEERNVRHIFTMEENVLNYMAMNCWKSPIESQAAYFGTVHDCLEKSWDNIHVSQEQFNQMVKDKEIPIKYVTLRKFFDQEELKDMLANETFRYQLLDRMRGDCEYYLGNGNRCAKHLWAQNETDQIGCMKELHESFPKGKKPEWLSMQQISAYEKQMASPKRQPGRMEQCR